MHLTGLRVGRTTVPMYIGQSKNMKERVRAHVNDALKPGKPKQAIGQAIRGLVQGKSTSHNSV